MHGWRLRKHFIQANALALLEFVAWTWKTPLLYYNGLKDRTDKEHVYTSVAISILDDLALPATTLTIYQDSALQGAMENSNGARGRRRHSCMENEARVLGLALPQPVTRD